MKTTIDASRLLRGAFLANALFSGLSSVVLLACASPVASFLGVISRADVIGMGVSLLVFAFWVLWLSSRELPSRRQALVVIALDLLWVIGTVSFLLAPPAGLEAGGKWAIAIVGDVVAVLAVAEILGFRRYVRGTAALSGTARA